MSVDVRCCTVAGVEVEVDTDVEVAPPESATAVGVVDAGAHAMTAEHNIKATAGASRARSSDAKISQSIPSTEDSFNTPLEVPRFHEILGKALRGI